MLRDKIIVRRGQHCLIAGLKIVSIFLFMALCLTSVGWAQDQATVVGVVSDSSGAVIPRAKVTISNPGRGFTRVTTSNPSGEYEAIKVPIGGYEITAEAAGFQKLIRTGITLTVGQTLRVDLQLTVGQTTQEITVTGNVARVETENGTLSDVINSKQVVSLNLNGRNWMSLAVLVPGAAPGNPANFDPTHVGFGSSQFFVSINGQRGNDVVTEVDGGQVNDEGGGGRNIVIAPNIDSIAEFRVSTSMYGADVGRRSGAVIEIATKGGTKDFHGAAYEFVRNQIWDSNNFFSNRQLWSGLNVQTACGGSKAGPCNAPKTPLKWNTFGYNVGGPVYIPGLYNTARNKTFFFWSENWVRTREGTVINTNVPTLRMRQGDFSECDSASASYNSVAASGCKVPKNPATGSPMDTLTGAGYSLDPNGVAMMNGMIPLPNNGIDGYVSATNLAHNYRQENVRVDQNIGDKTSLFVRVTMDKNPYLSAASTYDTSLTVNGLSGNAATVHVMHNFRSNLMNEAIVSWEDDNQNNSMQAGPNSPAGSIFKPSNWSATHIFPNNSVVPLLPNLTISGGIPFSATMNNRFESASKGPENIYAPSASLKDNLAYILGRHTLKTGFYLEIVHQDAFYQSINPQGVFTFNASGTLTTGNGLADMFLGRISQYAEGTPVIGGAYIGGYGLTRARAKVFEPYFQDDWKVNRRLTVNLGMRWQYRPAWLEASKPTLLASFLPGQYNPAAQTQLNASGYFVAGSGYNITQYGNGLVQCGSTGVAPGCWQPWYRAFAPRIGFAIDPTGSGKTSIRGGYGIYYDAMCYGHGPCASATAGSGVPPNALVPTLFNVNGYQNLSAGGTVLGPVSFSIFPYRTNFPMNQEFNLTVQHEFAGNNLVTIAYVGNLGRHLDRARNLNQVLDGATTANVPALAGTTDCDASGNCNVQASLINAVHPNIFFTPYRGYNGLTYIEDSSVSHYNSVQLNFRHTFGYGLTFQGAYTYEHEIDDAQDFTYSVVTTNVDDQNLSRFRATGQGNRTQVLMLNYVYDLPFFKNNSNHFLKNGLGGWQLSGIGTFYTGLPVDFTCTEKGYASGNGQQVRCNTLGPVQKSKGITNDPRYGPVTTWFDPSQIAMANLSQYNSNGEPGMFGYMGRNVLTGPGRNNWDIALLKNFNLPWFKGEHSTMQFRWETYNTFNHTQWQTVTATCGNTTPFGQNCSGNTYNLGNGEVASAWAPRIMQFGLKFLF